MEAVGYSMWQSYSCYWFLLEALRIYDNHLRTAEMAHQISIYIPSMTSHRRVQSASRSQLRFRISFYVTTILYVTSAKSLKWCMIWVMMWSWELQGLIHRKNLTSDKLVDSLCTYVTIHPSSSWREPGLATKTGSEQKVFSPTSWNWAWTKPTRETKNVSRIRMLEHSRTKF